MEAIIINEKMRQNWDEFVRDHPHSIAWQSYGWSDVVCKHNGLDFYPIAVFDGGRIQGILPIYHVKDVTGKSRLISVPYAVAGGMLADNPDVRKILLDKAIEISHRYNSCKITLKQYKLKIEEKLLIDDNYYNRELSLTPDIDKLWESISTGNQEKVTEALKLGAVLDYPSNDVSTFYNLLVRHHHTRGIPCVSKRWIEDLLAFQMYSIALLKVKGEIIVATMVKEFKDTISFPFTCLAKKDDGISLPAYALYWELIKYFATGGKTIFHSGRIPLTDDAEPHRLGWGGVKYQYFYQYYPNIGTKTEYTTKRGKKRELIEECWKRLPLSVAIILGPRIVKYFP
jgi:hypothetical protein